MVAAADDLADSYGVLRYELLDDDRLGVDCDMELMECTEYGLFADIGAEFVAVAVEVDSVRVLYG